LGDCFTTIYPLYLTIQFMIEAQTDGASDLLVWACINFERIKLWHCRKFYTK
jgi:hypothetical protein